MSYLGIGYLSHGTGLLDPDRYLPQEIECSRCREPEYAEYMSDNYDVPICPDCDEAIRGIELKVKYAKVRDNSKEFFDWLLNEAIIYEPEKVKALFDSFIESGTIGYEDWCISGSGRRE